MYNNNNPTERGVRNPNAPIGTHTAQGGPATTTGGMTYGQSAASGPAPTTGGHHKHDLLNKLDPRVDSTHDREPMAAQTGGSSIPEGTYGPHSSRLANALDPRVDSDLDSTRAGAGAGLGAGGGMGGHAPAATAAPPALGGYTGGAAGFGASGGGIGGVPEGTYGPHSSRVANALDPRVDSDRDRHVGPGATHAPGAGAGVGAGVGAGGMAAGTSSTTSAGAGVHHTTGPHKSDLLNKLDPRVDSKTGAWKGHGHGHGQGGVGGGQGPVV